VQRFHDRTHRTTLSLQPYYKNHVDIWNEVISTSSNNVVNSEVSSVFTLTSVTYMLLLLSNPRSGFWVSRLTIYEEAPRREKTFFSQPSASENKGRRRGWSLITQHFILFPRGGNMYNILVYIGVKSLL
jgi:hypothetical protein